MLRGVIHTPLIDVNQDLKGCYVVDAAPHQRGAEKGAAMAQNGLTSTKIRWGGFQVTHGPIFASYLTRPVRTVKGCITDFSKIN